MQSRLSSRPISMKSSNTASVSLFRSILRHLTATCMRIRSRITRKRDSSVYHHTFTFMNICDCDLNFLTCNVADNVCDTSGTLVSTTAVGLAVLRVLL
jgi:hypothetical protein